MRKIVFIVLLLIPMAALLGFEMAETGAFHPKVLAALGFILLCAYTFGEIAQRVGLPQVVGYITTGVLFGPHLTRLVLGNEVQALFNEELSHGTAFPLRCFLHGSDADLAPGQ